MTDKADKEERIEQQINKCRYRMIIDGCAYCTQLKTDLYSSYQKNLAWGAMIPEPDPAYQYEAIPWELCAKCPGNTIQSCIFLSFKVIREGEKMVLVSCACLDKKIPVDPNCTCEHLKPPS